MQPLRRRATTSAHVDTSRSPDDAVFGPGRRALTVGLLLTFSSAAFESLAVATILPATVAEIGGMELYGWAFSGFMLTNLLSINLAGELADRRGPVQPFTVGAVLFVVGLLLAGFAPSMDVLIVGRAVQGLGAGAISSIAYVAIARGYPASAQPRMLAMLSSAWVVPGLIGPGIAGTIADYLGWRWVFLGLAPLMAIAASIAIPALRRLVTAPNDQSSASRTPAAVRLTLGSGLVLFGISAATLGVAALCTVGGIALALPAVRRLTPRGTLRAQSGQPAAIATMALLSFAFFGAEAFIPLALTTVRGQSTTMAGVVLTAAVLAWTTGAWIPARFEARVSRRRLTMSGMLLVLVGIVATASVLVVAVPVWVAVIGWGISGLGIGLAFTTTTLVTLATAPAGSEGEASAAVQLGNVLGVALGTGLGGAILALVTSVGQPTAVGIALVDLVTATVAAVGIATAHRMAEPS